MITAQRFCGREFSIEEVSLIQEVVDSCGGISRNELAFTVCELLEWMRPNGKLKTRECLGLLAQLEGKGILNLLSGICQSPPARSGGMPPIFQPCLADESPGPMDRLGR
jgi:hypothetical protein